MLINYKNTKISYQLIGSGKTIVFLHGFLENKEMWLPIIENFKNNQIVLIDLLGHGKTGVISTSHTMEDQADMVAFVLDELKIENSFFVGHSMGGYVALALLEKKPDIFMGIALQNSTTFADTEDRKTIRTRFNKLLDQNFEATVSMSISNLFASNFKEKNLNIVKETQEIALKTSIDGIKAAQEGMKLRKDTTHVWKNAPVKKYLILGAKDEILNFETTKQIASEDEIFILPNGHMSHLEDQEMLISIYHKILN
jgi:pimeloyl-ACP methyl ester carboxylesterase